MGGASEDWGAILERLEAGDRVAFVQFNRLVTGFLVQLRAYDFEEEWDDLRQEVLIAVVRNARAGRLRDRQAFVGYVRIITRNKLMDRLKKRLRMDEKHSLPWEDEALRATPAEPAPEDASPEERRDLGEALNALPAADRRIVEKIYVEGCTYQEAADATGVPLGTLKRRLRGSLSTLRERLMGARGDSRETP